MSDPIGYDNSDSYGVPVSDPLVYDTGPDAPLASIYDYPEYVQYYEPDYQVVPDYSAVTETEVEEEAQCLHPAASKCFTCSWSTLGL